MQRETLPMVGWYCGACGDGMGKITIQQMSDRVAELMEQRLGARGTGLTAKLRRGANRLPRKVRAAARELARAGEMAENPKLLVQIDEAVVAQNYDTCVKYLGPLNRRARAMAMLTGMAAQVAMGILLLALIVMAILRYRGLL